MERELRDRAQKGRRPSSRYPACYFSEDRARLDTRGATCEFRATSGRTGAANTGCPAGPDDGSQLGESGRAEAASAGWRLPS
jgi:hypothetical protein